MSNSILDVVTALSPGDPIARLVEAASPLTRVDTHEEEFDGTRETVVTMPDIDTEILSANGMTVDGIRYGP